MVCGVKCPVINGLQCKMSGYQWFAVSKVRLSMVFGVKSPIIDGLQCKKSGYERFTV